MESKTFYCKDCHAIFSDDSNCRDMDDELYCPCCGCYDEIVEDSDDIKFI
ncbi:MAG: hypothetical protein ACFFDY_00025 [Candidatus Thorarchaeota archaeon]